MVGEEALEKMYGDGPKTNAEYLYHIDAEGEVDRVEIEWPVFIGTHYELRVVGGKVLVLLLDGNGLMGIDLQ